MVINSNFQHPAPPQKDPFSLKDLIGDGFLFAVPIFRRTLEVRKTRKIGIPYRGGPEGLKTLRSKPLQTCNNCGSDHEIGRLCPKCYERVKNESKEIWKRLTHFNSQPIEKDVVVLYEGEKAKEPVEFWQGKRIVEFKKPRPMWFSKNLLQKTTQPNAETMEVDKIGTIELKPSKLD